MNVVINVKDVKKLLDFVNAEIKLKQKYHLIFLL